MSYSCTSSSSASPLSTRSLRLLPRTFRRRGGRLDSHCRCKSSSSGTKRNCTLSTRNEPLPSDSGRSHRVPMGREWGYRAQRQLSALVPRPSRQPAGLDVESSFAGGLGQSCSTPRAIVNRHMRATAVVNDQPILGELRHVHDQPVRAIRRLVMKLACSLHIGPHHLAAVRHQSPCCPLSLQCGRRRRSSTGRQALPRGRRRVGSELGIRTSRPIC
jgi:hypothetical protein